MASVVDTTLVGDRLASMISTHKILDSLIGDGNMIACHRKAELEQLNDLLITVASRDQDAFNRAHSLSSSLGNVLQPVQQQLDDPSTSRDFDHFGDWTWQDSMSSTQLMNVVGTLNLDHFDWPGDPFST